MEPDLSLEGKVAIVTGAAGAVGGEIARTFAAHGATLVVVDSLEAEGAETAKELGGGTLFLACDVGDPDAVCSMVEAAAEKHGRLDILVNASAVGPAFSDEPPGAASYPDEVFSLAAAVAVNGSFYCAKYAAQRMMARGAGCIVTVVKGEGAAASRGGVGQATGAAGAIRLTEAMALDLGQKGLRVNAITAGGRATPVDIAHAALFLASDMAARINGATLAVGA
jgi:NAD(P)-dependent dehydrogenase (short-subunit alcohol dehydrogenase family)